MALRAELIGPYCLLLVVSSDCADLACLGVKNLYCLDGAIDSAKIDCGCPRVSVGNNNCSAQGLSVNN